MRLDDPGLGNHIVRFEPFGPEHRDLVRQSHAVEEMWRWMPTIPSGVTVEKYIDHVLASRAAGHMVPFALFRQRDGAFAGVAGFVDIDKVHRSLRVGFAWHPESIESGIIFPATHLSLIERSQAWRAKRIVWHIDTRNAPALRAMAYIHAVREATLRSHIRTADGCWSDMIVFSMLPHEARHAIHRLRRAISSGPSKGHVAR